jgi:predicted dinucleotide-binding enzyme
VASPLDTEIPTTVSDEATQRRCDGKVEIPPTPSPHGGNLLRAASPGAEEARSHSVDVTKDEHRDAGEVLVMTTAVIGTGGLGSVIARQLASGGETLRLSSADNQSARMLAGEIGRAAVVAVDNRDALRGADTVVLALRFSVLKDVIDEIADPLTDKLVVVPSNPVGLDAHGNVSRLLPKGQSSGEVVTGWAPTGTRLAMAFGTLSADLLRSSSNRSPDPAVLFYVTDDDRAGEEVGRLIRTAGFEPVRVGGMEQSSRLEVGGDLHDLVVGPAQARAVIAEA